MGFADLMASVDRVAREILGGSVIYTPGTGGPVTVPAIFYKAYELVDAGQPGISSTSPAAFLALSDLPSDPEADTGATITTGGTTYLAHEVQKDGLGAVLLLLHTVT